MFRDQKDIDGFISVDGIDVSRIINRGTGSHRYEITFKAPGGHSFTEFGLPSAVHAMGRAIAKIADVQVPKDPKTTFTVGTVRGGTSVNAIAGEARMGIDMRSNDEGALLKEEEQILGLVKAGGRGGEPALELNGCRGGNQAYRRPAGGPHARGLPDHPDGTPVDRLGPDGCHG